MRTTERKRKIVNLAYLAEHRISLLLSIIGGLDFNIIVRPLRPPETRNSVLQVKLMELFCIISSKNFYFKFVTYFCIFAFDLSNCKT